METLFADQDLSHMVLRHRLADCAAVSISSLKKDENFQTLTAENSDFAWDLIEAMAEESDDDDK